MTTMIERFFGMPQVLLRKGLLCRLSWTGVKLLAAIYYESERCCTRRVKLSTAELISLTGSSRNSLATARAELVSLCLVDIEMNTKQEFIINLCDPETGKPWPGDPKQKIQYQKKVSSILDESPDTARPTSPPRVETGIEGARARESKGGNQTLPLESPGFPNGAEIPGASCRLIEEFDQTCDINGTTFPFGYNSCPSPVVNPNAVMESLRGTFEV
jgi:hypothetical protein